MTGRVHLSVLTFGPVLSPLLSRYASSVVLQHEPHPTASNEISTTSLDTYGHPTAPLAFRIGNGGAGYTGILRHLSEAFIRAHNNKFRIEWVANHSRHSLIALCGDVVQVALTYEPEWDGHTIAEGWASRVASVFNDRFVLVGPRSNPARVSIDSDIKLALRAIALQGNEDTSAQKVLFHTRGDGSATFYKELQLFGLSGVDVSTANDWRCRLPLSPYEALIRANKDGAYLLTDRATLLTALRDGVIPDLVPYVEQGHHLRNPCSALVNERAPSNSLALAFAKWLGGEAAQTIVKTYGMTWSTGLPIFAGGEQIELDQVYSLTARHRAWNQVRAHL